MTRSLGDTSSLQPLRERLRGDVLIPGNPGYDEARTVWNGRFDRRPGGIARCAGTEDVIAAVTMARDNGLLVSVRSGGHDFAGNSVCDGGLMIDLSAMNAVAIDSRAKTARVQAGARWANFDREAQAFGLATTGGTVSTVGVAGYTLGAGTGWLSRKYGLALDNLLSAEVVLATGELVHASEREHADLFWALRGGSGNFGIVTSFEFRLHDVGPQVLAGQIIYAFESAPDVLRQYRSFMAGVADEVQCYPFLIRVPPLPVFPEAFHNQVAIDLAAAYVGDAAEGAEALAPLREFGSPIFDGLARQPYTALQQAFDAGMPAGNRWYSKAHYLHELSNEAIDTILRGVQELPGAFTMVYLEPLGGAIGRVASDATAFPHRDAAYAFHIFPGWHDPAEDDRIIGWARTFHGEMAPHSTGGVYVNQLAGDEKGGPRAAYGANYARLARIKRTYDPRNFFRMNHNITPGD